MPYQSAQPYHYQSATPVLGSYQPSGVILPASATTVIAAPAVQTTSARLVVTLPGDATLKIDGRATTSTSGQRVFQTPALEPGKTFHYTLEAEVVRDGQARTVTRKVAVRAGEETRVDLEVPAMSAVAD